MKKKLLVIVLVFCFVWGAMADNKLLDAIRNSDLDMVKTQIELLDVDVNEKVDGRYLLEYAIGVWCGLGGDNFEENYKAPCYYKEKFYKESDKYKPVIQYLLKKGAKVSDEWIQKGWMDVSDKYSHIGILKYMLDNKIIDMNRSIKFEYYRYGTSDMSAHYSTASVSDYYYGLGIRKDRDKDWLAKSILISQYAPIPAEYVNEYVFFTLLQGDITGVKNLIKSGTEIKGEFQLFISSKGIADLLKATDNYKLDNYNGVITPYYVGTIIPKYCTQCLTQDEIGLIKLIADYNSSMNRADAVAKVKTYIANGVDVNKKHPVLSGASIIDLSVILNKIDIFQILMDLSNLSITISSTTLKPYGNIRYTEEYYNIYVLWLNTQDNNWNLTHCQDNGVSTLFSETLSKESYEIIQNVLNERAEKESKIKAEKEHIAHEKAEKDLITNHLPKFCDSIRELLLSFGTVNKGMYKVKSKEYRELGTRNGVHNLYEIQCPYPYTCVEITEKKLGSKKPKFIYKFVLENGYKAKTVQKVWNMAVDQVCDEYGIK